MKQPVTIQKPINTLATKAMARKPMKKNCNITMFEKISQYLLNDIYTEIVDMLLKVFRYSKFKYLVDMQECRKALQEKYTVIVETS